ncbi:MAG: BREX-1 system phosphatase PglZ type A, partial [Bacillaceae bacterium]|nr:BREX-1 system phosphatase PglZ type A [Bacillaceae bacterium]
EKFFNNKDRYKKFQAFSTESFTEETIEMTIMAVLCNVKTLDFETIVKTVLMESLSDEENKYVELLEKFFDTEVFWKYVANHYGYEREKKSLKTLFMHLTVTALSHSIDESYLSNIKDYIAKRNKTNGLVFIDHWMHHKTDYEVYNEYAKLIEQEIKLSDLVNQISVESLNKPIFFLILIEP